MIARHDPKILVNAVRLTYHFRGSRSKIIEAGGRGRHVAATDQVVLRRLYLFRIDEDLVVDATKKGNLGYVAHLSHLVFFWY